MDSAGFEHNIGVAFRGKHEVIRNALATFVAGGHVLFEDVPGTGKTQLAKAFARALGLDFARVQCTPDLLPSDLTGTMVFDPRDVSFRFRPGPIFHHVVLADEINRASPRTQSALLEAMGEGHVTVDGTTHELPQPFFVMATQNPIEMEGTFPLPEAQIDRFMMRLSMGYPEPETEEEIYRDYQSGDLLDQVQPIATGEAHLALETAIGPVVCNADIVRYVRLIVAATRSGPDLLLGASPRAGLQLIRACKAIALLEGRGFVIPDDVRHLAGPVLAHRLVLRPEARLRGLSQHDVVEALLGEVPVPTEAV